MPQGIDHEIANESATLALPELVGDREEKLAEGHEGDLANRHVGIKLCDELIRQGVGNARGGHNLLKH